MTIYFDDAPDAPVVIEGAEPVKVTRRRRKVAVVLDHGQVRVFKTMKAAARYISVSHVALLKALREGRPCMGIDAFYAD